mgnify:CR=1 FL=1
MVLSHPECENEILQLSDYIGSTAEILDFASNSDKDEFIVCTEKGVLYELKNRNPEKKFYFPAPHPCCSDMKLNTLENILSVLENENNEVKVSDELIEKALVPLDKMLELAK